MAEQASAKDSKIGVSNTKGTVVGNVGAVENERTPESKYWPMIPVIAALAKKRTIGRRGCCLDADA